MNLHQRSKTTASKSAVNGQGASQPFLLSRATGPAKLQDAGAGTRPLRPERPDSQVAGRGDHWVVRPPSMQEQLAVKDTCRSLLRPWMAKTPPMRSTCAALRARAACHRIFRRAGAATACQGLLLLLARLALDPGCGLRPARRRRRGGRRMCAGSPTRARPGPPGVIRLRSRPKVREDITSHTGVLRAGADVLLLPHRVDLEAVTSTLRADRCEWMQLCRTERTCTPKTDATSSILKPAHWSATNPVG